MNQVLVNAIEAVCQDSGPMLIKHVRSLLHPQYSRPFLTGLHAAGHTRAAVTNGLWIKDKITKPEWNKIGIHNRWPGPFQLIVKEPIFRSCIPQETLMTIVL